jgi:hypothetical protein
MIQTPLPMPPSLDPNYVFTELLPLIAVVTVILVGSIGLRWIFRSPVGEAIAQRIREGRGARRGTTGGDQSLKEMEERVARLQDQVAELAERLDFTERLLAAQRERHLGTGG